LKIELLVSKNFLSLFTLEIVSQAIKVFSKANSADLELKIVWEEQVEYPVLKIGGFPPVVVKTPPSLSEVLNMLTLALDLSELQTAPLGMAGGWEEDTFV